MPGLTVVAELLSHIAERGSLAATSIREATDARRDYNAELRETERLENSSTVTKAKGAGDSTMGSREGAGSGEAGVPKAVTVAGLNAALAALRGRTK
jgi:vacuolar-type H+-ATPase subunit H